MLIGAHVSPAGGPANAVARGVERGCRAIQIFNQSPRQWKPTEYDDEKVAAFKEAFAESGVEALLIHAVYLVNCASEDPDLREKSLTSLTASLRAGAALGAVGVVVHPGSALKDEPRAAVKRAAKVIKEALAESEGCDLHLENTAGAGGTLGRTFEELAGAARGHGRPQAAARLPGLLPPAGQRLRHPDRRGPERRRRRVRPHRRPGPARLPARQRLEDRARLQRRPPRRPRRGRARRGGLRRLPVRAAVRRPGLRLRRPRRGGQGRRADRHGDRVADAGRGAQGPLAAASKGTITSLTGVGTLCLAPSRWTTPLRASHSSGRPASWSKRIEEPRSSG